MAIAYDAYSASAVSTSAASFSWTHTPAGSPKGVYVVTITSNSATEHATAVSYGGVSLTAESGGSAVDTTGEPAVATLWSLNSGVPTGAQTVQVTRTNDAVEMVAYAVTVTSGDACAVTGIVKRENDGAMTTEVAVDDGSPGTNSVRFCAGFTGNATTNPISAGASSTLLTTTSLGAAARQAAIARETTAGQGSRNVGWTVGVSDDRAVVYWAVKQAAAAGSSLSDVDTDETVTTGQASVAYTGTGLGSADTMLVKSGTKSASATSFSATNATSGTFTAPSLSAVRTGGVKFGSVTFEVKQSSTSLGTLAGTLNPESGWTVHNVSDISQAGDTGCIYYGQSPAIAVGDQVLFKSTTTTNAWAVTVDTQGFFTVDSGGAETVDTFTYYVFDATDETWGTVGTVTINPASSGTDFDPSGIGIVGMLMSRGA